MSTRKGQIKPCFESLPRCEGPKLKHFADHASPIEFVHLLGLENFEDSEESDSPGAHSHVFEVSIGGKKYALKVFRFYDDEEDRFRLLGKGSDLVSLDTLHAHQDPFYNECRAYGRLMEKRVNGIIAVNCYGYTTIPAERETELRQRFNVSSWDRAEEEIRKPVAKQRPLRAIVKDLISNDLPFTQKLVDKMLRDLRKMRRFGIYPMDIAARNYKAGLLLDFSLAMTKPHYMFQIRSERQVKYMQSNDLWSFQEMIDQKKIKTDQRAVRNSDYCSKLRSHKKRIERATRSRK
ncbi:hypothetical protein MMC18_008853 [Xylographa bjoerkii]|nr:hypothetical protein [Xylographa bjoerkii]MCJ1395967.1 hypothetical protein [Xylographa bjoerkii]